MKPCDYVVKESTPQNPSFERCGAATAPKSRFCEKHEKVIRENPAEEVRQNTLASAKK